MVRDPAATIVMGLGPLGAGAGQLIERLKDPLAENKAKRLHALYSALHTLPPPRFARRMY